MILNETMILERLLDTDPKRRLIVTPLIAPAEQLGPTSLDVRLGPDFQVLNRAHLTHLEFRGGKNNSKLAVELGYQPGYQSMTDAMMHIQVGPNQPFVLHPGEFALASTLEYIRIPLDLAARLEGRSTWGRLGLQIHATAGFVDPGFEGALTFELSNVSTVPIPLYPGVRIGQLCFFEGTQTKLPYTEKKISKYSGKYATAASAIYNDPEYARLQG